MNGSKLTVSWGEGSGNFALFRTLSSEQRSKTIEAMVRRDLVRGETLVAQGDPSDSLFMVLHAALGGAFALEQTFHLDIDQMAELERSPFKVLERLSGKVLA